jgi:hypothetical protein
VFDLANSYIEQEGIPKNSKMDALHIAMATVYRLDSIISLNFRHIVRKKTKDFLKKFHKNDEYNVIDIYSPLKVIDHE